jgi:hypothetical protein
MGSKAPRSPNPESEISSREGRVESECRKKKPLTRRTDLELGLALTYWTFSEAMLIADSTACSILATPFGTTFVAWQ